jgi:peptidoglycan/LPS O-acetylase OafA/YrhL
VALDGVRGYAAFAVTMFHLTGYALPKSGFAAVDLFFMLSGFVLAGAYEDRLRAGLSLRGFMAERLTRLYPLYLLGVTGGLALALPNAPAVTLREWLANLVFLAPATPGGGGFWLDPPMWSLSLEIGVNALFAGVAWRFSNRALALIVAASAAALAWGVLTTGGGNLGGANDVATLGFGHARAVFGFTLGWLAWRMRHRLARLGTARGAGLATLAIVAALMAPAGRATSLLDVFGVFPLALVALAFGPQPTGRLARFAAGAGALSYPLYATHPFTMALVERAISGWGWPQALLVAAATLAFAWLAMKTVDPLGRRALRRLFQLAGPRQPVPALAE